MANLRTDSPVARRIVRAFIDFLNSVEQAPGVDLEGLEVARECLEQVFGIDSSAVDVRIKPNLLVDIFSSLAPCQFWETESDNDHGVSAVAPSSSSDPIASAVNHVEASKSQGDDWTKQSNLSGASKDELFGKFFGALEKIHYFRTTHDGNDDPVQLEKATCLFNDAFTEMERSGCDAFNQNSLAESFKLLGNKAMQKKLYLDAIELYNCAVALCENNAVYYCNRAAAYTQIHQYAQAIQDCLKSIEIDPNYSKAYSRLGSAYYGQGNYRDALDKGFMKAFQLDPTNEAVKENIQVAEKKLKEEQQRTERDQGSASHGGQGSQNWSAGGPSRNNAGPPHFASMPFNTSALPADFANMFMNMAANAANAFHAPHSPDMHGEGDHPNGSEEPEVRIGGNISFNLADEMPAELSGALRSVMEMFSGGTAASRGNQQDDTNGRPPPQS